MYPGSESDPGPETINGRGRRRGALDDQLGGRRRHHGLGGDFLRGAGFHTPRTSRELCGHGVCRNYTPVQSMEMVGNTDTPHPHFWLGHFKSNKSDQSSRNEL